MRTIPSSRRIEWVAGLGLAIALVIPSRGDEPPSPVDGLLKLVPPDAGLVLTVEGLRDWSRAVGDSGLVAGLKRVPSVRSWLESGPCGDLRRAADEIEAALGVKVSEIRDDLLGDAVLLVLRLPPDDPPDPSQARGLLLLRARDRELAGRLISGLNAAQRDGGELERVDDRRRGETTYHVRVFPDGTGRPTECYVDFPDGTFAFSNSEEMIQGVIDRRPDGRGLGDSPRMIAVRRRLPARPMACLYVDPRAVERVLKLVPPTEKPAEARFATMLRRHLAAVDYAGAALCWGPDSIVVRAVETLEPSRLDPWLRRWAGDTRTVRPALRRVPRSAMVMASLHLDFSAIREAFDEVAPDVDHPRLRNLEIVLTGLLLGHDARAMLPALGPGVIAFLDGIPEPNAAAPRRGGLFPLVVVVDIGTGGGGPSLSVVADSLQNGLRTLLALMAMDEKHGQGRAAIASRKAGGAEVLTLDVPIPFAFAIDRSGGRLVLGTSAASVARCLESSSDPDAGARFRGWQAAAFPGFETFACVDLDALTRLADRYRGRLAGKLAARRDRPAAEVEADLDSALALARLFRAAFVASRIEPDASALHHCFGAIPRRLPESGIATPPTRGR